MVIIIIYIYMILQHWGGKLYLTRAEYVTTFLYETSHVLVPDKKLVMSYIPPNSAGVISTFFAHRMKLFLISHDVSHASTTKDFALILLSLIGYMTYKYMCLIVSN